MFGWFKKKDRISDEDLDLLYNMPTSAEISYWNELSKEKEMGLKVYDYVFHIGDKEKYQILDFSSTIDGICYIKNLNSGVVGRCLVGSLKKIIRDI